MLKKIVLPIVILVIAAVVTLAIVRSSDPVEKVAAEILPPLVRTLEVQAVPLRLDVMSQGSVHPRTESNLVAEISGSVTFTSSAFEEGAFFQKGQVLLRVDDRDYALAVESARAQVAQAKVAVALEEAEAEVAREEWKELGDGDASPLTLRIPQLQEAQARLAAAEAALDRSELDLERTEVRAPFNGRVRTKQVDVGEFVNRGAPLGLVYSIDVAEVRLSIPDRDLAFIDMSLDRSSRDSTGAYSRGPSVTFSADFAGEQHTWQGRIVRSGGEIDPQSRMVTLIAQVDDPYRRRGEVGGVPLAVGLFVQATIEGRQWDSVFEIPREALRGKDQVLTVDPRDRIEFRQVEVLRTTAESAVVTSGLANGDRVVLSTLDAPTNGMLVRTVPDTAATKGPLEITEVNEPVASDSQGEAP